MNQVEYRDRHQVFVTNLNGTSQVEVFLVTAVGPLSILLRNLALPFLFVGFRFSTGRLLDSIIKLLLDFIFTVLPTVLIMNCLSDKVIIMIIVQAIGVVSLLLFSFCEYFCISRDKPNLKEVVNRITDDHKRLMFITYFRSYVLIASAVAILSVDFVSFPRRFAKTENFGHSIMDVGTACIIFMSAITSSVIRHTRCELSYRKQAARLGPILPLALLGIIRMVVLRMLAYPQHISEYGVHCNFFLSLVAIRLIVHLMSLIVPLHRCFWLLSLLIGVFYQYCLSHLGLEQYILSSSTNRSSLLSANREGLCSVLGYLSLYLMSAQIGVFISETGIRLKSRLWRISQLILIGSGFFLMQTLAEVQFGRPSRRLANIPYILAMLCFNTLALAMFLMVEVVSLLGAAAKMPFFSTDENPFDQLRPCTLTAINRRPLFYFLTANLLTGLVNFTIATMDISDHVQATLIVGIYALVISAIVVFKCPDL